MQRLERPLLSTSVHVEAEGELEFAEAAVMMDMFAGKGLDFVVDCGLRVRPRPLPFLHAPSVHNMEVVWCLTYRLHLLPPSCSLRFNLSMH